MAPNPPDIEPIDPDLQQANPPPPDYAVYVRIVMYVMSSILAMVPLSWSSWVTFNPETQMLSISIEGLAGAAVLGLVGAFAVFRRWGVK